jgi:hypothetical protein
MENRVNHEISAVAELWRDKPRTTRTARKIQMAEECLAEARQHGFSLATLDQPLAKSFTDETGLVELLL